MSNLEIFSLGYLMGAILTLIVYHALLRVLSSGTGGTE